MGECVLNRWKAEDEEAAKTSQCTQQSVRMRAAHRRLGVGYGAWPNKHSFPFHPLCLSSFLRQVATYIQHDSMLRFAHTKAFQQQFLHTVFIWNNKGHVFAQLVLKSRAEITFTFFAEVKAKYFSFVLGQVGLIRQQTTILLHLWNGKAPPGTVQVYTKWTCNTFDICWD